MTKNLTYLLVFLFPLALGAQLTCTETYTMRVTARSGLNMRTQPSVDAEVLLTIPQKSLLIACTETSGALKLEGSSGYWREAIYEGKIGYVYDAYLQIINPAKKIAGDETPVKSKQPEVKSSPPEKSETAVPREAKREYALVTEAYNYCGAVEKIDPGILWYGFYLPDAPSESEEISVYPIELEIVLSKARQSDGLEFDIRTDREERSLFLLGSNRPFDLGKMKLQDHSDLLRYSNRKVFPGQQINLPGGNKSFQLSAMGSVTSTGDCPTLKEYQLVLTGTQSIDLMELLPHGQCGMPEIYWFGDFTGDGIPDFIMVSIFDDRNEFSLLVSSASAETPLLYKAAGWTIKKCK